MQTEFLFFGLVNVVFIPIAFYVCWYLGGRFSFVKHPLSYVSRTKAKSLYSTSLFLIAGFQILFTSAIFDVFTDAQNFVLQGLFYSGMISLALSGLITSEVNKFVHRLLFAYMVISITVWSFLFSLTLTTTSHELSLSILLITTVAALGVPALYLKTKSFGLSELLFAALTVLWNVVFLLSI